MGSQIGAVECGSYFPMAGGLMPWIMGWRIGAVDPTSQWAGKYCQWAGVYLPWILLSNELVDRCRGSYYPMGRLIGAGILLPNGPADWCHRSCYAMGWRIGAVDPTSQWASGYVQWILLSNGLADKCHGSYFPMGQRIAAMDPTSQWAGG